MQNEENDTFHANAFELWAGEPVMTNERTLIERLEAIQNDDRVPIEHRFTARNAIEELRRAPEPKARQAPVCTKCGRVGVADEPFICCNTFTSSAENRT